MTFSTAGVLSGTPAAGSAGDYYLVITASNGVDGDPLSTQDITLIVNTPLSAPTEVTASTLDASVTLNWQSVSAATGYIVYRGTSPGSDNETSITPTPLTQTTFTDTGVVDGTVYYYSIQAINALYYERQLR